MSRTQWPLRSRYFFPCAILVLALASSGCGKGKGEVSGRVTYKDKPIVSGTVHVLCVDGQQRNGVIDPDGNYTVPDVPAGPIQVGVFSANPQHEYLTRKNLLMNEEAKASLQPPDPELVKKWFPISESYKYPESSGLTFEVKRGKNEVNIVLERAPEKAGPEPGGPHQKGSPLIEIAP